jgi:hypothetical protein
MNDLDEEINDEMKHQIKLPVIAHHKKDSFVMKQNIRKGEIHKNTKKL